MANETPTKPSVEEKFTEQMSNFVSNNPHQARRLASTMRRNLEKEVLRDQLDLHNVVDDIQQQIDEDMNHEVNFGKGWKWFVQILIAVAILGGAYQLIKNSMELETVKFKYNSEIKQKMETKAPEKGTR